VNETRKVIIGFITVVMGFGAAFAWVTTPITTTVWTVRIITGGIAATGLGLLIWGAVRKDFAPDWIRSFGGTILERSGFQFLPIPTVVNENFCFRLWYQNRHENPCAVRVLLAPEKTFLLKTPKVGPVLCAFEIAPAGFGFVLIPVNAEPAFQGKKVSFRVHAHAKWPDGKGRLLRFRDGLNVGTLPGSSRDDLMRALALVSGNASSVTKYTVVVPSRVKEEPTQPQSHQPLWQLGDPLITPVQILQHES